MSSNANTSANDNNREKDNGKIPFKGELKIISKELANALDPRALMNRLKGAIEKDNPGIKCARLAIDKAKSGEKQ